MEFMDAAQDEHGSNGDYVEALIEKTREVTGKFAVATEAEVIC